MRNRRRTLTLILALAMLNTCSSQALAETITPNTVHIFGAGDLLRLSQKCTFDKWSSGKTVILENDIDLEGSGFLPIPIFSGVFDGKGHTIRGFQFEGAGSHLGFFRYVAAGAVIKNLHVQGKVTPTGDQLDIGGLAGHNKGLIQDCSFSGYVNGKGNVGGVVGYNAPSGRIVACSSFGTVFGRQAAGGIVGTNEGTVSRSTNHGGVNTVVKDQGFDLLGDLSFDGSNPLRSFADAIDIGGVAGVNSGVVEEAENKGVVGYPRVGYNVGGIAGRQSGYIVGCSNRGSVYGRKDVGGIAGQMEPHVVVSADSTDLQVLQHELSVLQSLIDELLEDVGVSSDEIEGKVSSVGRDLDLARAYAESLIDQTEDLLNKDIEEINRVSAVADVVMDKLAPVVDELADMVEILHGALPALQACMYHLSEATGKMPHLSQHFINLSEAAGAVMDDLQDVIGVLEQGFRDLADALGLLYEGEVGEALEVLRRGAERLQGLGETMEKIAGGMRDVYDHTIALVDLVGQLGDDVSKALLNMRHALGIIERATEGLPGLLRDVSGIVGYLSEQPPLQFQTTDDSYKETKEALYRAVDAVSDSVSGLLETVKGRGDVLLAGVGKVTDQLFLVLDLAIGIIDGATSGTVDLDRLYQDVSSVDTERKRDGKVSGCVNSGTVQGDINVGGVTGAMALELLKDAEDDVSLEGRPLLRLVFRTTCIVSGCRNEGEVEGKKNCTGGIAGNAELGLLKDCLGLGVVKSAGDYVGGIAGKAQGAIHSSYAKCTLSGGNYVGGIAGYAREVVSCRSIVRIDQGDACQGAVVGYADEGSTVKNNYFVSESLAGVDGISYGGRAEPLSYERFLALKGLPDAFKEFYLWFLVDGVIVKTQPLQYGEIVLDEHAPAIPRKPGFYARWDGWESLVGQPTEADKKVRAVYYPFEGVIESDEKREGPLALLLVEGSFTGEDRLRLARLDEDDGVFQKRLLEKWCVHMPDDGVSEHTFRFVPPKANAPALYVLEGEKWVKADIRWDGRYMVFRASGNPVTFALVRGSLVPQILKAGWWFVLCAAILVYLGRRRRMETPTEQAKP